jgi:hypothetical protein
MADAIQLSLDTGLLLKRRGLDTFEETAADWLALARSVARELCLAYGSTTSDDVIGSIGKPINHHYNVVGAIFGKTDFVRVGFTPTKRPSGHARMIGVWALKGEAAQDNGEAAVR